MAQINSKTGTILARCPNCSGALSTFTWYGEKEEFGAITQNGVNDPHWLTCSVDHRLFKCSGCGIGALGTVRYTGGVGYPGNVNRLVDFYPESLARLSLPSLVPIGIRKEFEEAERCMNNNCFRAAAGLFRSVLDKTMKANGYHTKVLNNLYKQIEAAAKDGVITQSRKRRAHDDVRVLGNDVLHDEWQEIPLEDVEAAQLYTQRILEDLYDDRDTVLTLLSEANRKPQEDNNEV